MLLIFLYIHRGLQASGSYAFSQAIRSFSFSLSANLSSETYHFKTPFCLPCAALFCSEGKTSFLSDLTIRTVHAYPPVAEGCDRLTAWQVYPLPCDKEAVR